MGNILNLVSEETFIEKMDTLNSVLFGMAGQNGSVKPTSWANVQAIARSGLASRVFAIGDQLTCNKGTAKLIWDIIGIDRDTPADPQFTHSITLQLHDCFASIQFDATEALYYAEEGLAAGTYNFTLPDGYDVAHGGGKTYQFTLTQAVPAGGQIMFPWAYNKQTVDTKISTYQSNTSTDIIETVSVAEGAGGIALTDTNHVHRIRFGSDRYSDSAVRQWLNGTEQWWTPSNKYDRPPADAETAGFMYGLDADFLAAVGKTKKVTALNTVSDGGGSEIVSDKFFLLSRSEVYGGTENNINEGEPYPYYANNSDLSAAGTVADSNRIKYLNGSPSLWWLRSPVSATACYARSLNTDGSVSPFSAGYAKHGVAPACCII